jgi:hypothetical protein
MSEIILLYGGKILPSGIYFRDEELLNQLRERAKSLKYCKYWLGKKRSEQTKEKLRKFHLGKKLSKKIRERMSISQKGRKHSQKTKEKISQNNLGKHHWTNEAKKHLSKIRKEKFSQGILKIWDKGIKRPEISGSNSKWYNVHKFGKDNPNWRGGKSFLRDSIRHLNEYKKWQKQIFERDNYTCQNCGKRNCYLEIHHIKSFSQILNEFLKEYDQFSPIEDKETLLRLAMKYQSFWDISNGITICRDCHNLTKGKFKNDNGNERLLYSIPHISSC